MNSRRANWYLLLISISGRAGVVLPAYSRGSSFPSISFLALSIPLRFFLVCRQPNPQKVDQSESALFGLPSRICLLILYFFLIESN